MRIVSGKYRSRQINPSENLPVRPTTDMAKESLFNIINNKYNFEDISVLDLFSGTGNIAYEFCSRGCKLVVSVEQNPKCIDFIKKTKDNLKIENFEIIQADCFNFIQNTNKQFDIIFADPPYDMPDYSKIVELIFQQNILNSDGILIVEHSKKTSLKTYSQYIETRNYGSVHFSFFKNI